MRAMLKYFIIMGILIEALAQSSEEFEPELPCFETFARKTWKSCFDEVNRLDNDCWITERSEPGYCKNNLISSDDLYDIYLCAGKDLKWFISGVNEAANIEEIAVEFESYASRASQEVQKKVYNAVKECAEHGWIFGDDQPTRLLHFTDCWIGEEKNRKLHEEAFCENVA
ncbi:uncharacterized protein LOC107035716 [Diachasma alloeum]|uniref:uncharacterized protein LOC107035716 n=1 Tax=Diachasma alloeum TaxID=454923 RepID=UPI000738233F|nr:uncharacterized protein LOC107035716 [Diachasma alloeum]